MMETALSLLVLATVGLLGGAVYLRRRGGSRKQITLMVILAVVMVINVAIWTLPDASGSAPLSKEIK